MNVENTATSSAVHGRSKVVDWSFVNSSQKRRVISSSVILQEAAGFADLSRTFYSASALLAMQSAVLEQICPTVIPSCSGIVSIEWKDTIVW